MVISVRTDRIPGEYRPCQYCSVSRLCRPDLISTSESDLPEKISRRIRAVRRGVHLFKAGDAFRSISAICAGSVKTYTSMSGARIQVTGLHLPGEVLGLGGLSARRHLVSAVALESVTVCEFDFVRLDEIAQKRPALLRELMIIASGEILHENETKMSLLGKRTAEARLAAYLFQISRRYAARGYSPEEFNLGVSRSDIGNYLGLAKETVSRLFSRFEEEGVLTVRAKHVRVDDLPRLRGLAGADTQSLGMA